MTDDERNTDHKHAIGFMLIALIAIVLLTSCTTLPDKSNTDEQRDDVVLLEWVW